jgi:hypothetical protein
MPASISCSGEFFVTQILSRRELFDLVWSKPVTKVATDLGISDVAVKKICDKHRIPVPGRGYWAKIAAGQKLRPAVFRDVSDPLLNRVRITGSPMNELPSEVLATRKKVLDATRKAIRPLALEAPLDPEKLHPVALRIDRALQAARPLGDGRVHIGRSNLLDCTISPASVGRAVAFVEKLVRQAEERSFSLISGDERLVASVDGETINIQLVEITDKVKHQPTDAEVDSLERWTAKVERANRRGDWFSDFDKPKIPEFDWVPSGRLSFLIDQGSWHSDGIRRKWTDGVKQRLEGSVPDIIVGLATCAAAKKAEREREERRKKEWAEEQARREEVERRQRLEAKRVELLNRHIALAEQARTIEVFVEEYVACNPELTETADFAAFIDWAGRYAAELRKLSAPKRLESILNKHALMDDRTKIDSWIRFDQ